MNWNDKAQDALRESETDLPESVQQRLAAARREAVNTADSPQRSYWPAFLGTGALASAAVVLVLLMPRSATNTWPLLEDTEMAAAQDVELLEELEFVAWMLAEESADVTAGKS